MFVVFFLLLRILAITALVGYDCFHVHSNISTVSLLEVEECQSPQDITVVEKTVQLQVLQDKSWSEHHVYHCNIKVVRIISYCGMDSHNSMTENGLLSYIHKVSRQVCLDMHRTLRCDLFGGPVDGLIANDTFTFVRTLAGTTSSNGACTRGTYTDMTGSYSGVFVVATIDISLKDYTAVLNLDQENVQLMAGVTCKWGHQDCLHPTYGYTFWESIPEKSCTPTKYSVLYEGIGTQVITPFDGINVTYMMVNQSDFLVALKIEHPKFLCHQEALATEHPRLYVILKREFGYYFTKQSVPARDVDLSNYVNSKFVFLERHLGSEMNRLSREMLFRTCQVEHLALKNRLALAKSTPHIFGDMFFGTEGHYGIPAGEVIHIIECQPVPVTMRSTSLCYNGIPVEYNNISKFLLPVTRVLVDMVEQVECSSLTPMMFRIDDSWISLTPKVGFTSDPVKLSPLSQRPSWNYRSIRNLAIGGLYDMTVMEAYRTFIMAPLVSSAAGTMLTRAMQGLSKASQGLYTPRMFDPEEMKDLAKGIGKQIWGWFSEVGYFFSGFIGIYFCWKIFQGFMNIAINALSLHRELGFSFKLFGAIFSSLTNFMLWSAKNVDDPPPPTTLLAIASAPVLTPEGELNSSKKQQGYPDLTHLV